MNTTDIESKQSKGGKARALTLTSDQRKDIAKRASIVRWKAGEANGLPEAICEGELLLGQIKVRCVNLSNGKRVINSRGVMEALGRPWKGTYKSKERPNFLEAKNLEYLISGEEEIESVLDQIEYRSLSGTVMQGYDAVLIPMVCDVYLQARKDNKLKPIQAGIAETCELIMRGLAQVGIVALVDEATGYQDFRAKNALATILEQFIAKELQEWTKTFPDEFYRQMFRLRGWAWSSNSVRRPSVIGRYTNDFVYERLAPGILDKLREMNPPVRPGQRQFRHHQWLTGDVGHPELKAHLDGVVALMKASMTWAEFRRLLTRSFPKVGELLELPMPDPVRDSM